jgi:DnaJ-class molecular chaperone
LTPFQLTTSDIKRAYRRCALLVHPDKNSDSRTVQAFHAVENAASIFIVDKNDRHNNNNNNNMDHSIMNGSGTPSRQLYDAKLRERRKLQYQKRKDQLHLLFRKTAGTFRTFGKVMGPYAKPVLMLGALMM